MDAPNGTPGGSTFLKALFYLISALVFAALGYAGWIIAGTWGRVGV